MSLRPLLLAALLASGAAAQEIPPPVGLYGKMADGVYTAPGETYRVPVPVLPELGGQVRDTENVVTFDDDLTTHVSIACFPLDQGQKWELEMQGRKGYLTYFYVSFVLPDFQKRFPGSDTESSFFIPGLHDGSLLAISLLPGGSFYRPKVDPVLPAGESAPPVAKRGSLLFVHRGNIFVVSAELTERVSQGKAFGKTEEQENEILRDRLLSFVRRIEFPTKPGAAAPASSS
jgi:hypothetical protein